MAAKTFFTVEQWAQLPDEERGRYELDDGELIEVSSPCPDHQLLIIRLIWLIGDLLRRVAAGVVLHEVDCRLGPARVRRPDLSFFFAEKWKSVNPSRLPIPFAPDLAIEIVSQSDTASQAYHKARSYLDAGSREVWLVFMEDREILVRRADSVRIVAGDQVLESPDLLPGLAILVSELFAPAG